MTLLVSAEPLPFLPPPFPELVDATAASNPISNATSSSFPSAEEALLAFEKSGLFTPEQLYALRQLPKPVLRDFDPLDPLSLIMCPSRTGPLSLLHCGKALAIDEDISGKCFGNASFDKQDKHCFKVGTARPTLSCPPGYKISKAPTDLLYGSCKSTVEEPALPVCDSPYYWSEEANGCLMNSTTIGHIGCPLGSLKIEGAGECAVAEQVLMEVGDCPEGYEKVLKDDGSGSCRGKVLVPSFNGFSCPPATFETKEFANPDIHTKPTISCTKNVETPTNSFCPNNTIPYNYHVMENWNKPAATFNPELGDPSRTCIRIINIPIRPLCNNNNPPYYSQYNVYNTYTNMDENIVFKPHQPYIYPSKSILYNVRTGEVPNDSLIDNNLIVPASEVEIKTNITWSTFTAKAHVLDDLNYGRIVNGFQYSTRKRESKSVADSAGFSNSNRDSKKRGIRSDPKKSRWRRHLVRRLNDTWTNLNGSSGNYDDYDSDNSGNNNNNGKDGSDDNDDVSVDVAKLEDEGIYGLFHDSILNPTKRAGNDNNLINIYYQSSTNQPIQVICYSFKSAKPFLQCPSSLTPSRLNPSSCKKHGYSNYVLVCPNDYKLNKHDLLFQAGRRKGLRDGGYNNPSPCIGKLKTATTYTCPLANGKLRTVPSFYSKTSLKSNFNPYPYPRDQLIADKLYPKAPVFLPDPANKRCVKVYLSAPLFTPSIIIFDVLFPHFRRRLYETSNHFPGAATIPPAAELRRARLASSIENGGNVDID